MRTTFGMLFAALSLLLLPTRGGAATVAYSGLLTSGGAAASGTHQIGLRVYQGASFLCEAPVAAVAVSNGRFRVQVPAACATQIQAGSDVVVRVVVNGAELPGMPVGSVPFALRAELADVATVATAAQSAPWGGITGSVFAGSGSAPTAARSDHNHGGTYVPTSALPSLAPPGSIMAFGGSAAPPGWFLCDGRALRGADYPDLFAAISTSWGNGTTGTGAGGGTNFNVPDLRGRFLRGLDSDNLGTDPDRANRGASAAGGATGNAVGTVQSDQVRGHSHPISDPGHRHRIYLDTTGGFNGSNVSGSDRAVNGSAWTNNGGALEGTGITGTNSTGGNETRPLNAAVNFIIKY